MPGNFVASPTVADGYVFIGSNSGEFYELSESTGAVVARANLGHQPSIGCPALGIVSTAAVAADPADHEDTVYVADPMGYLDAMAIPSLTVKWRSVIAIPSKISNNYFDWSSPTVANGKVYVGISSNCDHPLIRGGVAGFNQATGHRYATFYSVPRGSKGGSVWTSVAVDSSGYVYAATGNPEVGTLALGAAIVKLNPISLQPVGHFTVPPSQLTRDNDFGGSPTIFGTRVGACNHNGIYYAVDRATMRLSWDRRIGAKIGGPTQAQCAAGAVFDGTYLYIGGPATTIGGRVYPGSIRRVNPVNGNFLWGTGLANTVTGAPTMNGAGVLAVGTYGLTRTPNAIYLVNGANGKKLRTLVSGSFDFAQSAFADGELFTANGSGLYAWKL